VTQAIKPRDFIDFMLLPGQIYMSEEPSRISTVLGSCVAVCLWNSKKKIGAMCHYLYPFIDVPEEATAKYGNVALGCMIRLMTGKNVKKNTCAHRYSVAPLLMTEHAWVLPRETSPWRRRFSRGTISPSYPKMPVATWAAR